MKLFMVDIECMKELKNFQFFLFILTTKLKSNNNNNRKCQKLFLTL